MTDSAELVFAALRPVVGGLAETFGRSCEVVLHDYRDVESSVDTVAGDVTGRRPGDSMSEIGLRVLTAGDLAQNEVNYLTRTEDGRLLKCSTFPLRAEGGALIGALCINLDVTVLARAGAVLAELSGTDNPAAHTEVTNFSGSLDQMLDSVVARAEASTGSSVRTLTRLDRLEVVRSLNLSGVFALRGASQRVADRLGISRAGLYNDLRAVAGKDN